MCVCFDAVQLLSVFFDDVCDGRVELEDVGAVMVFVL